MSIFVILRCETDRVIHTTDHVFPVVLLVVVSVFELDIEIFFGTHSPVFQRFTRWEVAIGARWLEG